MKKYILLFVFWIVNIIDTIQTLAIPYLDVSEFFPFMRSLLETHWFLVIAYKLIGILVFTYLYYDSINYKHTKKICLISALFSNAFTLGIVINNFLIIF